MTYKTIVIDYAHKAKKLAAAIEKTANERAKEGWELLTFSLTHSDKAILLFRVPDDLQQEQSMDQEVFAQKESDETYGDVQ